MKDCGYNPMRWDCERDGCWNESKRPRIEEFADCFPGRINFGDVDGPCARTAIVEINSRALLLEWKDAPGEIPRGQRVMYENLSRLGFFYIAVVAGDPRSMNITHAGFFVCGAFTGWQSSSLEAIKDSFRFWAGRAKSLKPIVLRKALVHEQIAPKGQEFLPSAREDLQAWIAECEAWEPWYDELVARLRGKTAARAS